MNKEGNTRNEFIHLYNPKKEGWTSYDINYANALKNIRKIKDGKKIWNPESKRYAA